MEIVPPGSPVPLEVTPPSSRGHHGPSFTSSSNAVGNLLAFTYTSYDLLLIPFVMLLNYKSRTLTSHLVSKILLSHYPLQVLPCLGLLFVGVVAEVMNVVLHAVVGLRADLSPSFCSMGLDGLLLPSSSLGSRLGCWSVIEMPN